MDNNVADFGSRYPRDTHEGEEFEILRPTICTKSRRVQEVQFSIRMPSVSDDDTSYIKRYSCKRDRGQFRVEENARWA